MRYNLTIQDIRSLVSKVRSAVKPETFVKDFAEMFELFFRKTDEREEEFLRKIKSIEDDIKKLEKRYNLISNRVDRVENRSRN